MADAEKVWIYVQGQTRHGPSTASELATLISSDRLAPTTLVWKPGMKGWAPATDIAQIADLCAPTVPVPTPFRRDVPNASASGMAAQAPKGRITGSSPDRYTVGSWAFALPFLLLNKVVLSPAWATYGEPVTTRSIAFWITWAEGSLRLTLRALWRDPLNTLGGILGASVVVLLLAWPIAVVARGAFRTEPSELPNERLLRFWINVAVPLYCLAILALVVGGASEYLPLLVFSIVVGIGLRQRLKVAWFLAFIGVFLTTDFLSKALLAFGAVGNAGGGTAMWFALNYWKRVGAYFPGAPTQDLSPATAHATAAGGRRDATRTLLIFGLFLAWVLVRDHNWGK